MARRACSADVQGLGDSELPDNRLLPSFRRIAASNPNDGRNLRLTTKVAPIGGGRRADLASKVRPEVHRRPEAAVSCHLRHAQIRLLEQPHRRTDRCTINHRIGDMPVSATKRARRYGGVPNWRAPPAVGS